MLGQRGPTLLHPTYPPRGTRRSGRGGLLSLTPLPAPGNQTLGQRGRLPLNPSARLDLSHPRPPFLRGPPGPPGGTPTCPPGEPGHPTLKPGSLTRPNCALRRTGPLVTPGEIYHWSPLIDFGRLASDFQGEPGVSLCPPSALPSRGTPLRSRPRCFPRHWSPLIVLSASSRTSRGSLASRSAALALFGSLRLSPRGGCPSGSFHASPVTAYRPFRPGHWYPRDTEGSNRGRPGGPPPRPTKTLPATHETLTQNQVVYESFSTGFSTNFRCASREGRRSFVRSPVQ